MTLVGTLLAESLRVGASLDGVPLTVERIYRRAAGDPSAGQPVCWTFIEFGLAEEHAETLARGLADTLDGEHGWYCDFRSDDETFVVFAGRVFRYPRGDRAARLDVEAYARSVGVPEAQLDWPA